jgi:hypothetical protein
MRDNLSHFDDGGIRTENITVLASNTGPAAETSFRLIQSNALCKAESYFFKPFDPFFEQAFDFPLPS